MGFKSSNFILLESSKSYSNVMKILYNLGKHCLNLLYGHLKRVNLKLYIINCYSFLYIIALHFDSNFFVSYKFLDNSLSLIKSAAKNYILPKKSCFSP